ncbi:MAG: hypothetical protein F4059_01360 [Gemmatimonadetes bacterium]|nr:hypothetical protein [Gemmatimonadota bacterium]
MNWRQYLITIASAGVLIGLAMGIHYGHMHHESTPAEPEEAASPGEREPWPEDIKAQMLEGCAEHSVPAGLSTEEIVEQCTCTLDYYEQNATLREYLEWSAAMVSGHPPGDEKYKVFEQGGLHCAILKIVTPTP